MDAAGGTVGTRAVQSKQSPRPVEDCRVQRGRPRSAFDPFPTTTMRTRSLGQAAPWMGPVDTVLRDRSQLGGGTCRGPGCGRHRTDTREWEAGLEGGTLAVPSGRSSEVSGTDGESP